MESIKVRRHIGQDGILHLDIPVGITERDVEVMVIYQSVPPSTTDGRLASSSSEGSLEQFYGICADDPIILDDQGVLECLDDDLAGAFD
ncbi:MAG: hypothetical protein HC780_00535 [Leptolyngbyaceae cyanobacterium CSU_1_3]|nr:hypothetical protein [Leptolyngbyaceae cyanobacterium CSU_1_3]